MTARFLDRPAASVAPSGPRPAAVPDPAYDARSRLAQLRDALAAAVPARGRWKEPPLFFFDRRRQAELEATRTPPADPFAEVAARVAAELPMLCGSIDVRRVARATDGLAAAAAVLAPLCPAANDLAELLAVPDDEVVLVLHPAARVGFRLAVRGVADVGQFHVLLADATADASGWRMSERLVTACQTANPTTTGGVPMTVEGRVQMYTPSALTPDGTLPAGFGGCEHWLWPATPLAAVPRVGGERVVLLGPPAFRATWGVERRFPAMTADVRLLEVLSPFRVAEHLGRLTGRPIPPQPEREPLARAG